MNSVGSCVLFKRSILDAGIRMRGTYETRPLVGMAAIDAVATYSFYGDKIISAGEGGMIPTNDGTLAAKIRLLRGQGMDPQRRCWFLIVGYNCRVSNLAAAIGCAQLERIEALIARRREIAAWCR